MRFAIAFKVELIKTRTNKESRKNKKAR